jgi:amidase
VDQVSNITGWPDLVVPAGFTGDPALPVGLSFIGPAFSEARLLGYGYAFEIALPARRLPVHTPVLPGDIFDSEVGE